jgi:hypothetical protein
LITSVHDEYRSTLGRTLSDRIATFLDKLPVKERLQLAQDLAAKTTNPGVRIAILAQAKDGSFYQGSSLTVAEQLGRLTPPGTNIAAERDRVVLAACMRYLMTLHPLLIKVIWQDFLKGSIFADNATIARSPFYANAYPALDRIRHPEFWASLKGLEALTSVNNLQATRVLDRSILDPYVLLWHNVPLGAIIIVSFLLGGGKLHPREKNTTNSCCWIICGRSRSRNIWGELRLRILHAEILIASFDHHRICTPDLHNAFH